MPQKQTVERVKTDLELNEEITLHEKGWVLQRIGWLFIFLMVALAAMGFFGDGIMSQKTHTDGQTKIGYERFFRYEARMELKVDLQSSGGTQTMISFPNSYLQKFRVESILPEPKESFLQNNSTHYLFAGTGAMTLVFYLVPQASGSISGWIGVNNRRYPISHFIYP